MGRCKQADHCGNPAWCKTTGKCLKAQVLPHDAGSHDQPMTPAVQRAIDEADKRARDKAAMPAACQTPTGCRENGCHGDCLPQSEREAFERWITDHCRYPQAAERNFDGSYRLMSTVSAWTVWQACWPTARAAIYSAEQAQIEAPLRAEIERLRAEVKALRELWDEAEAENGAMRAVNRARLLGA